MVVIKMKLFDKLMRWLDDYYSQDERVILENCREQLSMLKTQLKIREQTIKSLDEETAKKDFTNKNLVKDIKIRDDRIAFLEDRYAQKIGKHYSLETFKKWMDNNIKPKKQFYNYGKGSKQPHTIFSESIKDREVVEDFTKNVLKFDGSKYENSDNLIYYFNRKLTAMFPTKDYYAYDKELYGQTEYWATAKETIEKLKANKKGFDCDDSMTLRFSCLFFLLKNFFPQDLWRLRGFIVDLWSGGGHALLGWIKKGINDWVAVETTFKASEQWRLWEDKYVIRNQLFYQVRYSFDEKKEYVKL